MKKTTLTIAIPAFNEEQNIESFLRSVLAQKLYKVRLEQILIYSDCSDDQTNSIVKKLAKEFSQIKLIEGTSRKGKYFRVNQLFHLNKSDVEIMLDADIALVGNNFLEKLTTELVADPKALMMAAHVDLVRPNKFSAKVLHTGFILGDFMRLNIRNYDSAANFHGAATAYKLAFTKTITIPQGLSDPHLYIYLVAKKKEGFRYCRDAAILQWPPSTIADVKKVMRRSIGKRDPKLAALFGEKMIHDVHVIPFGAKIRGVLKCLFHYPLYTPLGIGMIYYFGSYAKKIEKQKLSPIWDITKSTKKPISYAK